MAYSVGKKVQAVDELGRWEAGKVKAVEQNGTYLVSFDGWGPEFDRNVSSDELREPIEPFVGEQGQVLLRSESGIQAEMSCP
ncbi:hypothetical protein HOLleu_43957 [Holothuria leucospilota]|uniref:Tudor domain-containing protein n=1 Tax=Holothuria leucospilota TaxID=206669 RepID=A0A9Q0Y965_HOLLE|nr:hypothetical protein HOLleu_43957 [Holothuria leucospilota]